MGTSLIDRRRTRVLLCTYGTCEVDIASLRSVLISVQNVPATNFLPSRVAGIQRRNKRRAVATSGVLL